MGKLSKVKQIESIVSNPGDKFTRCLATGKFYKNDREITRAEWDSIKNKTVLINLGEGAPAEPKK